MNLALASLSPPNTSPELPQNSYAFVEAPDTSKVENKIIEIRK